MRLISRKLFTLFILLAAFPFEVWATHLRAGEIRAQLLDCNSPLHYKIDVILYTDLGSTVLPGGGALDFGDGSPTYHFQNQDRVVFQEQIAPLVGYSVFTIEHTYPGAGTYTIRYKESNRNGGVANMDNSVNTPFYIESQITIDPFLGCDNTPILLNPPIDEACVGRAFYHNPGAFDIDGDSISYELDTCKQDINLPVANYSYPDDYDIATVPGAMNEEKTGPPTYTLDPLTGNLTWDAPAQEGEYNIAIYIREWRNGLPIGYVVRDMQIIVMQCDNQPPVVLIPNDTCIQAGTDLKVDITATDPDNDPIILSAFGAPFQVNPAAVYSPIQDQDHTHPSPDTLHFEWATDCPNVQKRPYQVTFKVKDSPPPGKGAALADFKNWFITVIGPPPQGLMATAEKGRTVQLTWDSYSCSESASKMQIWRRVDSTDISPGPCDMGMPANSGYELIGTVDIGTTSFLDNNDGEGLDYGATYCYRLVAEFPAPGEGESYVSEEACVTIQEFGPVITKVSITNTGVSNGKIDVQWTSQKEGDSIIYKAPFSYRLYRTEGTTKDFANATEIKLSDTTYTDTTNLNTQDLVYNYKVVAYDAHDAAIDSSAWASSVRLSTEPVVNSISLSWDADVPWSNNTQKYPYHYIYRDHLDNNNPGLLELLDSTDVTQEGFTYLDSGQVNKVKLDQNTTYCYYVTTQGSYGNPRITSPLLNNSQIICAQPNDTTPPCEIEANTITINKDLDCKSFVSDKPCNFDSYYHVISWSIPRGSQCENDISGFEIWFSKTGDDNDFKLLTTVSDTTYTHSGLSSFAGCYKIRAVDRSGNKGDFSDKVCYQNCPNYELPNVFTPNNDGHNDEFQAFSFPYSKCPRFVKSVDFRVYDRWGTEVYHTGGNGESSIYINWDGRTNDGKIVDSGVYYYIAYVQYDNIASASQNQEIKGWIQVLR